MYYRCSIERISICIPGSASSHPGYALSSDGVSASAEKVKAVKLYTVLKNAKDARAFLCLSSFYRMLVPNFAEVAKTLMILTRRNQPFLWGTSQQGAFEGVNDRPCTPTARLPEF